MPKTPFEEIIKKLKKEQTDHGMDQLDYDVSEAVNRLIIDWINQRMKL